ncbi:MAG TPA: S8 family serine peptidase, partial [Solirubrobacteraceae bacterium]
MRADPRAAAIAASLVSVAALLLAVPSLAGAASPPITTQAAAADAAFLAYAPPPAGGARALCLVDTGVNPTPDTAPGLVSATALDGGAVNDVDPLTHGTIDAAIAGGAGNGILGAWPQLKIVSVRATDVPSAGQIPTFGFDDYSRGITRCATYTTPGVQIAAIALPLSSMILPTPDQALEFADAVAQAKAHAIAILAAAGNDPGPIQLPGSQPGVLAVGAGDSNNAICSFSAWAGLTFYAPGCGLDQINSRGESFCCGNGTSQASVFAAAALVALRSYKPELTGTQAVQQLLSTTRNGHLDVAAAFRAAGLGAIVDAGTGAIPKPLPAVSSPVVPPAVAARRVPRPSV